MCSISHRYSDVSRNTFYDAYLFYQVKREDLQRKQVYVDTKAYRTF